MTRTLRFLLLAGLTFFVLGGAALLVLAINAVLLVQALVLAIPLGLIVRDAKRTAKRFGLTL